MVIFPAKRVDMPDFSDIETNSRKSSLLVAIKQ